MSLMLTKEDLAKYPFLKQSETFFDRLPLNVNEIEEYSSVVKKAVERIKDGIELKITRVDLSDPDIEILAYPVALALVYGSKSHHLLNRFATAEAKRVEQELRNEPRYYTHIGSSNLFSEGEIQGRVQDEKLVEIAKAGFDWKIMRANVFIQWEELQFSIPIETYLEVATSFNDAHWKLINRYISNGRVFLNRDNLIRLISEAFKIKIIKRASEKEIRDFRVPESLQTYLNEILEFAQEKIEYEEELLNGLVNEAQPPCIVALTEDLKAGKNLSHMARFTLTTFMVNVGESVEEVLKIFGNVADFDEEKARYQVEHIAGKIGSKQKYQPPRCDVLRSFGLCIGMDEFCKKIKHPLQYYKKKIMIAQNKGGESVVRDRKKRI